MTASVITASFTPEDLLRMPDNSTKELVDGQIVEKHVSVESSDIEGNFYFRFRAFLREHPIAKPFPASLGYQCFADDPTKVRKPDVTVVRLERLQELPGPNPGYMPIIPDLAVEVISPNDVVYDVDAKIKEFLEAGFPLIWVADPMPRTITVYKRGGRPVIFTAEDELTAESVMPGFRCRVGEFFETTEPVP